MSDSPAGRPKRNSSFASFYIDEDDFEDSSSRTSTSKKVTKEDVFVISEKYDDSSIDDSSQSEFEDFEPKTSSIKIVKKEVAPKKNNVSKSKPKSSSAVKSIFKGAEKSKKTEDDFNFEIVVTEEDAESDRGSIKTEGGNSDGNYVVTTSRSKKPSSNKSLKPMTSFSMKPSIIPNRPKLPSSVEKVRIPGQSNGPRRVGLSRSAPTRPLSPVKLKKIG